MALFQRLGGVVGWFAATSRRARTAAASVAAVYRPRQWFVIVFGSAAAIWLYHSSSAIAAVHDPPPVFGPAIDYVVPVGRRTAFTDGVELSVQLATSGCRNPVRVVVVALPPYLGRRRTWLRQPSRISFGVEDDSARNFRIFTGEPPPEFDRRLFERGFHGSATFAEVATGDGRAIPDSATSVDGHRVAGRFIEGTAPPFPVQAGRADVNPWIVFAFEADWLLPRTHRTCYLRLPLVIGPGPGAPLLQLPRPPDRRYLGNDSAHVGLSDWDFASDTRGVDALPMTLVVDDTRPRPPDWDAPQWSCIEGGDDRFCNGGYVALAETNAAGRTSSGLFLRGTLLGVLAALVAEALLRYRSPSGHDDE
jgi:hypothetical protein